MAFGAILAGTAVSLAGQYLGRQTGGLEQEDIDNFMARRNARIDRFSEKLAGIRQNFSTKLSNLNQRALSQFAGTLEAGLASRGFSTSGKAFGTGLARETANVQAQQEVAETQRAVEDAKFVEGLRASASQQAFGQLAGATQADMSRRAQSSQSFFDSLTTAPLALAQGAISHSQHKTNVGLQNRKLNILESAFGDRSATSQTGSSTIPTFKANDLLGGGGSLGGRHRAQSVETPF